MGLSAPASTAAIALVAVALAVGGCAAALQQSGHVLREHRQQQEGGAPLTYFTPEEEDVGITILAVLGHLGYTATDDPLQAHVLWTLSHPFSTRGGAAGFSSLLAALQESPLDVQAQSALPFINHLPGTPLVAHKKRLAALAGTLPFLPRTFRLPGEFQAWQTFLATPEGAAMEWVRKSGSHRGVELVEDPRDAKHGAPRSKQWLAQQLVRPYVLHNRVWDLGVYVVITSVQPLLAYVHTGFAVLRFTSEDYQGSSGGNDTRMGWVIDDALTTPAELEAAQAHFSDAGVRTIITASRVLAWLSSQGLDSQALWLEAQSQIVQVLRAVNAGMTAASDDLPLTHTNAFELLRFDFMLDEHKQLFLIECNMSPSLIVWAEVVSLEQQNSRQCLVHDVLSLKGLALGGLHHPATSPGLKRLLTDPVALDVQEPACAGTCRADCSSSPRCMLCHACRSQLQTHILQQLQAEHYGSHSFLRLHPPHAQLAGFMAAQGTEGVPVVQGRPEDVLAASWLAAKCRVDPRWC